MAGGSLFFKEDRVVFSIGLAPASSYGMTLYDVIVIKRQFNVVLT